MRWGRLATGRVRLVTQRSIPDHQAAASHASADGSWLIATRLASMVVTQSRQHCPDDGVDAGTWRRAVGHGAARTRQESEDQRSRGGISAAPPGDLRPPTPCWIGRTLTAFGSQTSTRARGADRNRSRWPIKARDDARCERDHIAGLRCAPDNRAVGHREDLAMVDLPMRGLTADEKRLPLCVGQALLHHREHGRPRMRSRQAAAVGKAGQASAAQLVIDWLPGWAETCISARSPSMHGPPASGPRGPGLIAGKSGA